MLDGRDLYQEELTPHGIIVMGNEGNGISPAVRALVSHRLLIPNYHFIEVKDDFSDLEERLAYYIAHPDEAEAIIRHAHEYVDQFRDKQREKLISLLVLDKYFRMTGQ